MRMLATGGAEVYKRRIASLRTERVSGTFDSSRAAANNGRIRPAWSKLNV